MSEFTQWKDDTSFIASEAVRIITQEDVLALKVWWLNPPGVMSTRVSVEVPTLSADKREIVWLSMVAGWKCSKCKTLLFGTSIQDLYHSPCCDKYRESLRRYDG